MIFEAWVCIPKKIVSSVYEEENRMESDELAARQSIYAAELVSSK
jgi:hypothetical protein